MLYTTLSKLSSEQKYKKPKHYEKDEGLTEGVKTVAKNVFMSFNNILKQKYGRKLKVKQARQGGQKRGSKYISKGSSQFFEIQLLKDKCITSKPALYWQNRPSNIKRHTYNHHCHTSGREGEPDHEALGSKQQSTKFKSRHPVSHTVKSQQLLNRSFIQRRMGHKRERLNNIGVSQCNHKQANLTNHRIFSKHSKITSIQLNPNHQEKPPLVDLIKKYGFQNLKTSHLSQSKTIQLIHQNGKYVHQFIKTQPLDQTSHFFTEESQRTVYIHDQTSRNQNKTASNCFRKYQRILINKTTDKVATQRLQSILTPWATDTDRISIPLE